VSDLEGDGLQEVRSQGAKGLSVTRTAKINRRQFLTGTFRERNLAERKLGERYRQGREDEPHIGRDFTAPETAPQIPDWDNGIESVLEEMENLKGIEDF
jgi:hypothetical protein